MASASSVNAIRRGNPSPRRPQSAQLIVSDAGGENWSPSGWNCTVLTVSDGAIAVIVTGSWRAPGGTVSEWGPTWSVPPSGPMVSVVVAEGRGEHLSNAPSTPEAGGHPSRFAAGGGALFSSGVLSPHPARAAVATRSTVRGRRVAFMGASFPFFRGRVRLQRPTRPRSNAVRKYAHRTGASRDAPDRAGRRVPRPRRGEGARRGQWADRRGWSPRRSPHGVSRLRPPGPRSRSHRTARGRPGGRPGRRRGSRSRARGGRIRWARGRRPRRRRAPCGRSLRRLSRP